MTRGHSPRRGFTLIELLVVIGVILILAAISLLVVPNILSQDRTTEGAARVQQWLSIAKSRAARDKLPHGVRFINNGSGLATEAQFIASPGLEAVNADLFVNYKQYGSNELVQEDIRGQIGVFLIADSDINTALFTEGASIFVPEFNTTLTVQRGLASPSPGPDLSGLPGKQPKVKLILTTFPPVDPTPGFGATQELELNRTIATYPDLGVGLRKVAPGPFQVLSPSIPLIGEPVMQLPTDIAVDLNHSQLNNANWEVVFSPAGDVLSGAGQCFLWVRNIDPAKGSVGGSPGPNPTAGEQQVVAIKSRTGAIGVFPLSWSGDAFQFARNAAN